MNYINGNKIMLLSNILFKGYNNKKSPNVLMQFFNANAQIFYESF